MQAELWHQVALFGRTNNKRPTKARARVKTRLESNYLLADVSSYLVGHNPSDRDFNVDLCEARHCI